MESTHSGKSNASATVEAFQTETAAAEGEGRRGGENSSAQKGAEAVAAAKLRQVCKISEFHLSIVT